MSLIFPANGSPKDLLQSRLMFLAALFLLCFSLTLTFSPAVRAHSWDVDYLWQHWGGVVVWLAGFSLLHRQVVRFLPDRDPYLLPLVAIISGWGLLTIWRLSPGFGLRQTVWLAVSLGVFLAGIRLNGVLPFLQRYKYLWLTAGLLLTAATFILGVYPGGYGPQLWLGCCGIYLQPSEPLKLLLIAYLSAYLVEKLPGHFTLPQILAPTVIMTGLALFILVVQRDLGTATLFLAIYAVIIYMASNRLRIPVIIAILMAVAGFAGYRLFDVIALRVEAWLNPWLDPSGRSYQIVQSLITVASGGVMGRGPGLGSPGLVPVAHSDFIFAAIAEETGLVGTLGVLAVLGLLVQRGMIIALHASTRYQRLLAGGLTTHLGLQSILIIAGNLRLLPLTGVTLPFVSYGGSSLLTSFISALLLCLISSEPENEPAPLRHTQPYLFVTAALSLSLLTIAIIQGWWAVVQSQTLQDRTDNPRRAIADRYVRRGALLDRNNVIVAETRGEPGSYRRHVALPGSGPIVGYTHPVYGQAGLELALDPYLRGLRGHPSSSIWTSQLFYGQPPPGVDVRLTLDTRLQVEAERLLEDRRGAVIVLNALTGEIVAMASFPNFDPNLLDEKMPGWMVSNPGVLVNRAAQSTYPLGAAITPFLLASYLDVQALPTLPQSLDFTSGELTLTCALPPASKDWGAILSNGCPGALFALASDLADARAVLGPYSAFQAAAGLGFSLPAAQFRATPDNESIQTNALGQAASVSPLQLALAAAAISKNGMLPPPTLVLAVQHSSAGWLTLAGNPPTRRAFPATGLKAATRLLERSDAPYWETIAVARTPAQAVTWYLSGTLPDWQGTPIALVLALEENDPRAAQAIGRQLIEKTLLP